VRGGQADGRQANGEMLHAARSVVRQWQQQQWSQQEAMRGCLSLEVQTAAVCQGRAGQGVGRPEECWLAQGRTRGRACTSRSEALRYAKAIIGV
jgi:hypothetical protein